MGNGKRGKPEVFSVEENACLREALKELQRSGDLSQAALGEQLGVGQQSAGRLLSDDRAGFSRGTANALANRLGYASAESMLRRRLPRRTGTHG